MCRFRARIEDKGFGGGSEVANAVVPAVAAAFFDATGCRIPLTPAYASTLLNPEGSKEAPTKLTLPLGKFLAARADLILFCSRPSGKGLRLDR